jgi:hypothetical protein
MSLPAGRRIVAVSVLASMLLSCTTWQVVPVGAGPSPNDSRVFSGEYGLQDDARDVRIRLTGGRVAHYRTAAFHGDSLYGFVGADSVAYARDSVEGLDVRKLSRARSVALGAVGVAALIGLGFIIANNLPDSTKYLRPAHIR